MQKVGMKTNPISFNFLSSRINVASRSISERSLKANKSPYAYFPYLKSIRKTKFLSAELFTACREDIKSLRKVFKTVYLLVKTSLQLNEFTDFVQWIQLNVFP